MIDMRRMGAVLLTGMGFVFVLGGCADKLTRAHYDMIVVNTSDKLDVDKTLGKPDTVLDDQWHYERVDKHLNVFIQFNEEGVVTRKQWVDAVSTEWDDTEPAPQDRSQGESTTVRKIVE